MKIITLTRPAPYQCEGVTLLPGRNQVSDDDIARLTRNPLVMRDINSGILQINHMSGDDPAPEPEPADDPEVDPADDPETDPEPDLADDPDDFIPPEPEPTEAEVEVEALRELAAGDGRRADVRAARARLAELEAEA